MDYNTLVKDFIEILNHFKQTLFEFFPNFIAAVFIFLLGFLIAGLVRHLIARFINSSPHFIPNKRIRARVKSFIEERPIASVIGGIFYWLLILFFLTIATETIGLPVITTWLSGIVGYLPKILSATLIGIAGAIGGMILRDLVSNAAISAGIVYGNFLGKLVQVVVILITIIIGIDQIGIDVTLLHGVFIITIGALLFGAALAFGFGAKASVSNILASYYLQKTYKVGDKIKIGEKEGVITQITPIAVLLDSSDGQTCIPSQQFNEKNSILLSRGN